MMSKLVDAVNWMSTWIFMNIKGQCHLLTVVQGHSYSTFSNFFSRETARPIEARFNVEPQWDVWTKVCSNGSGHMTKMDSMPIYMVKKKKKKKWKILLLWIQKADDHEHLYTASGTRVLPSLFKWLTWADLDLFYDKVKCCPLCFFIMSTKGQGHWLALVQITQIQYF